MCWLIITARTTTVGHCSGYFRCSSGQLICANQLCDDIVDCDDLSDERSCHGMQGRFLNALSLWMTTMEWMCVPRIGSFPSALNTWSKVSLTLNPYMSLFNLKLCTHIRSTNINFRPSPTYIGLFGPSWSEHSPCG